MEKRLKALYDFIVHRSLEDKKTTQRDIITALGEYGYKEKVSYNTSDLCSLIWRDIARINESPDFEFIIITHNYTYWVGTQEETANYIKGLWYRFIQPKIDRANAYRAKFRRHGQCDLLGEVDEKLETLSSHEAFIEEGGKEYGNEESSISE